MVVSQPNSPIRGRRNRGRPTGGNTGQLSQTSLSRTRLTSEEANPRRYFGYGRRRLHSISRYCRNRVEVNFNTLQLQLLFGRMLLR